MGGAFDAARTRTSVSDGFFRASLCRLHLRGIFGRDRGRDLDDDALSQATRDGRSGLLPKRMTVATGVERRPKFREEARQGGPLEECTFRTTWRPVDSLFRSFAHNNNQRLDLPASPSKIRLTARESANLWVSRGKNSTAVGKRITSSSRDASRRFPPGTDKCQKRWSKSFKCTSGIRTVARSKISGSIGKGSRSSSRPTRDRATTSARQCARSTKRSR